MIKKIFEKIVNYKHHWRLFSYILFLGILFLVVWGPAGIPTRCAEVSRQVVGTYNPASFENGIPSGIPPPLLIKEIECYSPLHKEYWQHPEWSTKYQSIHHLILMQYVPTNTAVNIHLSYPVNYSDDVILMGASHNVFIGKVVSITGNSEFVGNPATQFSVQVIRNIKGDLKGNVTVNQEGGFKNEVLYQIEENKLLVVGNTYLLSTRYNPEDNSYTLNPHENASKLLSTDLSLSMTDLQTIADKDTKVNTLKSAYPKEVLLDADVKQNNARESFQSLAPEAKATAAASAEAAKASLESSTQAAQ